LYLCVNSYYNIVSEEIKNEEIVNMLSVDDIVNSKHFETKESGDAALELIMGMLSEKGSDFKDNFNKVKEGDIMESKIKILDIINSMKKKGNTSAILLDDVINKLISNIMTLKESNEKITMEKLFDTLKTIPDEMQQTIDPNNIDIMNLWESSMELTKRIAPDHNKIELLDAYMTNFILKAQNGDVEDNPLGNIFNNFMK